jgi:hypothetical protein
LLGNKEYVSKALSLIVRYANLAKVKLSFPSHGSRAAKCFDIVHSDVPGHFSYDFSCSIQMFCDFY